jgi:hypothetical protein
MCCTRFLRRHPGREQVRRPVCPAHKHMEGAVVLILAENDKALAGKRMKGIPDHDFVCRNRGIMSPFPIAEGSGPLPCIR